MRVPGFSSLSTEGTQHRMTQDPILAGKGGGICTQPVLANSKLQTVAQLGSSQGGIFHHPDAPSGPTPILMHIPLRQLQPQALSVSLVVKYTSGL